MNRAFGPSKLDSKPAPRLGREWRHLLSKEFCHELHVYRVIAKGQARG